MKIGIFHIFLFIFLLCLVLETLFEPLRYLKYTLPFITLTTYFFINNAKLNYRYFSYFKTFLIFYFFLAVYLLIKALILNEFQDRFFANAGFILFPLLFIFFLSPFYRERNIKTYVKIAFAVNVFIFFLLEIGNLQLVFSNLGLLKAAIISSKINTENQLAYGLGLFLFYFLFEKYPKRYIIICAILFVLSFKRITMGAFLVSFLYYFLVTKIFNIRPENNKYRLIIAGLVVNLLFIQLLFSMANGDFNSLIKQFTNLSTNDFFKGRQYLYRIIFDKVGNISWDGIGLGQTDYILRIAFKGYPKPLHSDILKNYLEFGAPMFVLWIILLFYKTSFSNKATAILIYFNVLMLTDNVFIYFDFMVYFYFFILVYISQTFLIEEGKTS
jgi:hypothetical protein